MKRDQVVWGIILIVAGLAVFAFQFIPGFFDALTWPWIMIGIGTIFIVASLLSRIGGLMIPGFIVGGLGGIFLWQEGPGDPASWSYIWTLIPGFVGLGMLVGGLFDREMRDGRSAGVGLVLFSGVTFALFGGFFGLTGDVWRYWPVLLILVGAFLLLRALFRSGDKVAAKSNPDSKDSGETSAGK